ncbi:MAG: NAD(P)/FAD-dependent oxidoreductase [Granulosicoccus sp.]
MPWLVVGAGITGLSAARELAILHPSECIVLVDAREIGQGASGRNSGYAVSYSQFPGSFNIDLADEYRRINRINQAGLSILRTHILENNIDCDWFEDGFHHAAIDKMAVLECGHYKDYLQRLEIPHTELDQTGLQERLGSSVYKRGFHVHEGALLQPAALVRGLAKTLPENVTLFESSPVLNISYDKPISAYFASGTIKADKVVLATNYEASHLGILNRRLIGSTLSGSFTRILHSSERECLGSKRQWGVLSLHGGGATVRLTKDGRICLRNTAEYHGGQLLSDKQLRQRQSIHREAFEWRFPQLKHVPFEYAWSGVEGISRNSTNFFGQHKPNVFVAGGYNGSGVSRGTAFGSALANFASAGQSTLITDCLNSKKATWLPPRPFLDIGAAFSVRSRFRGVGLDR